MILDVFRFRKGMVPGSINIPFMTAFSPEGELSPCLAVNILNSRRSQVIVVIGNRGRNAANVNIVDLNFYLEICCNIVVSFRYIGLVCNIVSSGYSDIFL